MAKTTKKTVAKTITVDIKYIPIDSIKVWEENPRLIKDKRFKQLCKSISSDPLFMESNLIKVQKSTMTIYGGNMRWRACKQLGWEEVPVVIDDIDDVLMKARAIKDNSSYGEYNDDLSEIIEDLKNNDYNIDELGLDEAIAEMLEPDTEIVEDEVPEPPKEPKTKLGDLYGLGEECIECPHCQHENLL